jgi:hypothetical protein
VVVVVVVVAVVMDFIDVVVLNCETSGFLS